MIHSIDVRGRGRVRVPRSPDVLATTNGTLLPPQSHAPAFSTSSFSSQPPPPALPTSSPLPSRLCTGARANDLNAIAIVIILHPLPPPHLHFHVLTFPTFLTISCSRLSSVLPEAGSCGSACSRRAFAPVQDTQKVFAVDVRPPEEAFWDRGGGGGCTHCHPWPYCKLSYNKQTLSSLQGRDGFRNRGGAAAHTLRNPQRTFKKC